jgi:hypothetical protein
MLNSQGRQIYANLFDRSDEMLRNEGPSSKPRITPITRMEIEKGKVIRQIRQKTLKIGLLSPQFLRVRQSDRLVLWRVWQTPSHLKIIRVISVIRG